ncbi:hypothetical protein POSPLADRAFT_1039446, partial [Postia placenta MAD-698-R-SB12]
RGSCVRSRLGVYWSTQSTGSVLLATSSLRHSYFWSSLPRSINISTRLGGG